MSQVVDIVDINKSRIYTQLHLESLITQLSSSFSSKHKTLQTKRNVKSEYIYIKSEIVGF